MANESVFEDLIGFLKSDRADLRIAATEATLGVTDRDSMAGLIKYGAVAPLCKLSSRSNEKSGLNALETLVYLSSHGSSIDQCVEDILACGGVSRMVEISLSSPNANECDEETWRKRVNYSLALLANMTRTEQGAVELCGKSMPDEAVSTNDEIENVMEELPTKPTVSLILSRFLSNSYIHSEDNSNGDSDNSNDPYQHFSSVLMNATQVEQGRKFALKITREGNGKPSSVLQKLLPHLRSKNVSRRRGVAGVIKNCCFEKDVAWWLLNEVKIASYILYPLAGPEELEVEEKKGMDPDLWLEGPDKVREPDQHVRVLLVESILLLLSTGRKSRETLRLAKTYAIFKIMDMSEESEEVSEKINECVQFLRRDEEGTVDGSSDNFVAEAYGIECDLLALPAPSASQQIGAHEDYDDVD